ncbi:hypothetical protein AAX20_08135 [Oenococcus oeni]|nr:hypothetical protein AAX20_08135 [Oenococcus oeni]
MAAKKNVTTKVILDFVCQKKSGKLSISNETSESRWIPKNKVLDFISYPIYQERFQNYLDFNGEVNYLAYFNEPNFAVRFRQMI